MKRAALTLSSILIISGLAMSSAQDDAVFLSDAGVMAGYDWLSWPTSKVILDHKEAAHAPEGKKVWFQGAQGRSSGIGIYAVTAPGRRTEWGRVMETDLSDYANGRLKFWMKSSQKLRGEIEYVSKEGVTRKIPFILPSTKDAWVQFDLPFSKFPKDLNFSRIRSPFMINVQESDQAVTWQIDHVRWTRS